MSHLHAMYRTSDKVYTSRPPANCKTAREAWDYHAKSGPVLRMRLLDGYWGVQREEGGMWHETENTFAVERARKAGGEDAQA